MCLVDVTALGAALARAHHESVVRVLCELAWLEPAHLVVAEDLTWQASDHEVWFGRPDQLQYDVPPVDGPRRLAQEADVALEARYLAPGWAQSVVKFRPENAVDEVVPPSDEGDE